MLPQLIESLRGVEKAKAAIIAYLQKNNAAPGSRFFSQRDLAKLLEIDPMTAHKALRELSNQGVLYREKGRGTFVSPQLASVGVRRHYALVLPAQSLNNPGANPENWHIVQRLLMTLAQAGTESEVFSTVFINPGSDPAQGATMLAGYDAVLFLGEIEYAPLIQHLATTAGKQVVLVSCSTGLSLKCLKLPNMVRRNVGKAVLHLLDNGYKRIAYCGSGRMREKLAGYKEAIASYGIDPVETNIVLDVNSQSDGPRGASILLKQRRRFDSIFVDTDMKAVGVVEHLRGAGISVPDEIAVMGFDGLDLCVKAFPFLASFKPDIEGQIKEALLLLREQQSGVLIDASIEKTGAVITNMTVKERRLSP